MPRLAVVVFLGLVLSGCPADGTRRLAPDSGTDAGAAVEEDGGPRDAGDAGAMAGAGGRVFPWLGVYTVQLDGGSLELLVDAHQREFSHVRRLGATRWMVATRFGQDFDRNGLAMEGETGNPAPYTGTEIVLFTIDAPEDVTVLAGSPDGGMAANASWTDDGRVLFIEAEGATSWFTRLAFQGGEPPVVASREVLTAPSPLKTPVDPHQAGPSDGAGRIVFSAWLALDAGTSDWMRPLWMMPASGASSFAQISLIGCPLCPGVGCCGWATRDEVLGTNDARLNHAGTEVVWMQQHPSVSFNSGTSVSHPYRQVRRPLDGGLPVDLMPEGTQSIATNAYAEWSPDDQLLAFWSIEAVGSVPKQLVNLMLPDAGARRRVPLPDVLCPQHVSFFDADHLVFNAFRCAEDAGCTCDIAFVRP